LTIYHIPDGKRVIADGGYPGDIDKLSTYNQFDSERLKKFKARVKSRHETVNARLKIYEVLKGKSLFIEQSHSLFVWLHLPFLFNMALKMSIQSVERLCPMCSRKQTAVL
jgi:hypothetical protein